MKRMMMTMAMVVMMISSVSAKNMSNRPNYGKQPTCTCCKHGDCKQDKCQPKQNSAFGKKNTKKSNKTNNTNISKSSNKSFGNMKR